MRLYSRMGTATKFCEAELHTGVFFTLDLDNGLCLVLQSASKFELVPLESDLRVLHEPKVLLMVKAMVARQYDYGTSFETLSAYITEIE